MIASYKIIRFTARQFAPYVDVWRTVDFLNHVPNMHAVLEEVAMAGKINEPCLCFFTGPEHTNGFYVSRAREILEVTGRDVVLCIKNHGGLGTPRRIGELVDGLKLSFPDVPTLEIDGIVTAIYGKKGKKLEPGERMLKIDVDPGE